MKHPSRKRLPMSMEDVGAPLFTPQTVSTEATIVNNQVMALQRALERTPRLMDTPTGKEFMIFRQEWADYFASIRDSWLQRSLNATYDIVQIYKTRTDMWRKRLLELGADVIVPVITDNRKVKEYGWQKLILGAIAGAGVFWGASRIFSRD